jgi:hypothetical protein
MGQRTINFVEGDGISVQVGVDPVDPDVTDVEIGNTIGSLLDAKGDLLTASDLDTPARLEVGADGQVLTADSTAETGLRWLTGGGGGGSSPSDTAGWMPLTTVLGGTPDLVWDSTDNLIPTYGPF